VGFAACARSAGSVERSLRRLRRSDLWRRATPHLAADAPSDHWLEGCWRLICFHGVYEGEAVTAVFAIRLGLKQSVEAVAFVDEERRRVVARFEA
jgi:hypothetical protein